jgi:transcriptional regulator with XRE-family HTH domain
MDLGPGAQFPALMPRRDDPQIGLGKAIRTLRDGKKLSQETLGNEAGIHPTWISHIESGRINPTWGNVRRIARGLGVPLEQLAALAEEFERKLSAAESSKR